MPEASSPDSSDRIVPGGSWYTSTASRDGPAVPASMIAGTATPAWPARSVR